MTPTTNEREARELLAREYRIKWGDNAAVQVLHGPWSMDQDAAIRAILAALTREQREGVVECGNPCSPWNFFNGRVCEKCIAERYSPPFGKLQQEAPGAVAFVMTIKDGEWSGTLEEWRARYRATQPAPVAAEAPGAVACEWHGQALGEHHYIDVPGGQRCTKCKHEITTPPAPVDVRVDESVRDALALLERATYHDGRYRQMEHDDWQQEAQQLLPRLRALIDGQPAGVVIDPKDVTVESWPPRPSPGGQHVGTGPCGVKVTHKPSGLVVCFDRERSQHHNRQRAMAFLQAALGGGVRS